MPRFAANLSLMFTEVPFLDRFEAAARAGFEAVEFLFPYAFSLDDLHIRLKRFGLELVLFNLPPGHWDEGERGITALKGREAEFSLGLNLALKYAEALGCQRLHAMSGLCQHGADEEVYYANLHLAAEWAKDLGKTIVIEPINTYDLPGYFLSTTEQASAIIKNIGVTNLMLQFDMYHHFRMGGNVIEALKIYAPIISHYQCAHPLDRSEPWHDVLNYAEVFSSIDATGYDGWVGCEYKPKRGTLEGLGWMNPWRDQKTCQQK
ncbi:MAG: 2-oxo-tetronate isomerase [Hyphomicrobium sp.]